MKYIYIPAVLVAIKITAIQPTIARVPISPSFIVIVCSLLIIKSQDNYAYRNSANQ